MLKSTCCTAPVHTSVDESGRAAEIVPNAARLRSKRTTVEPDTRYVHRGAGTEEAARSDRRIIVVWEARCTPHNGPGDYVEEPPPIDRADALVQGLGRLLHGSLAPLVAPQSGS